MHSINFLIFVCFIASSVTARVSIQGWTVTGWTQGWKFSRMQLSNGPYVIRHPSGGVVVSEGDNFTPIRALKGAPWDEGVVSLLNFKKDCPYLSLNIIICSGTYITPMLRTHSNLNTKFCIEKQTWSREPKEYLSIRLLQCFCWKTSWRWWRCRVQLSTPKMSPVHQCSFILSYIRTISIRCVSRWY